MQPPTVKEQLERVKGMRSSWIKGLKQQQRENDNKTSGTDSGGRASTASSSSSMPAAAPSTSQGQKFTTDMRASLPAGAGGGSHYYPPPEHHPHPPHTAGPGGDVNYDAFFDSIEKRVMQQRLGHTPDLADGRDWSRPYTSVGGTGGGGSMPVTREWEEVLKYVHDERHFRDRCHALHNEIERDSQVTHVADTLSGSFPLHFDCRPCFRYSPGQILMQKMLSTPPINLKMNAGI